MMSTNDKARTSPNSHTNGEVKYASNHPSASRGKVATFLKSHQTSFFLSLLSIINVVSVIVLVWNILETRSNIDRLDSRMYAIDTKLSQIEETVSTQKLIAASTKQSKQASNTKTPPSSITTTLTTTSTITTDNINATSFAFKVLQIKSVTYHGYDFLAVRVQLPVDGLSKSENWCRDYQYLCESFSRRPTGCTGYPQSYHSPYKECREIYNSDGDLPEGLLDCSPFRIAEIANIAFPNMLIPARSTYNSFGFYQCDPEYCRNTTKASDLALTHMKGFWDLNETDIMYTVCR